MKLLNTVLALTALVGWMPALLALLAVQLAIAHGASEWAELTFDVVFISLYLTLLGGGAWVYSRWF